MSAEFRGLRVLIGLAALLWGSAAGTAVAQGSGQPSAAPAIPFAEVAATVPAGAVVYVTDATGGTTKGMMSAVKGATLEVLVAGSPRRMAAEDVRRIQWEKHDPVLNGVLIGAGIGAIPGIYWLIVDPNECTGMCREDYVSIVAGAAIGGLIDRAIKKRLTVYQSAVRSGSMKSVALHAIAGKGRRGLQFAVRF